MKKLTIIAVVLAVGVSAGFASSLKVPWFVDNAPEGAGIPSSTPGKVTGLITLSSNRSDVLVCSITYYNSGGDNLGPAAPNNTFTIDPLSSLAFRPVKYDPDVPTGGIPGGQEGAQAVLVPDRPRDVDTKKNGGCVIEWVGGPSDVQGQVAYFQTATGGLTMSYAHLLPPGT